jgi:hypothetical protein
MSLNLKKCVLDKIALLGTVEAARFYGVSVGTISNWATGKTSPPISAVEATVDNIPSIEEKSEPLTMWAGRKVAILQPAYRTMNPDTHFTMFACYAKYGVERIALLPPEKRTVIHEARNILIHKAMKTDAETFIMNDDDMIVPFGEAAYFNYKYGVNLPASSAGLNAISRIMSHGKEHGIIGALYFGRHAKGKAQCSGGFENQSLNAELRLHSRRGLMRQGWVGTGFIKIERWVIEKMKAEIDAGKFPECKPINLDAPYGYFSPLRVGVGEDVSFGRRCESIGIASYLDCDLECLHAGERNYCSSTTSD